MKQLRATTVEELLNGFGIKLQTKPDVRYIKGQREEYTRSYVTCDAHSNDEKIIASNWKSPLVKYYICGPQCVFFFKMKNGQYAGFRYTKLQIYGNALERFYTLERAFEKMAEIKQYAFEEFESTADNDFEAYMVATAMEGK